MSRSWCKPPVSSSVSCVPSDHRAVSPTEHSRKCDPGDLRAARDWRRAVPPRRSSSHGDRGSAARGDRRRAGGSQGLPRGAGAGMNGAAGLILEDVSAGYGDTVVLEGISLRLPLGQTLAVLGRNGVGKTTLLATITGHTRLH